MATLEIEVARKLLPLLKPARYKAAHGGRAGMKSHFFAERVIVRCYRARARVVCIREVQSSLRDSSRQILINKIQKMGLGWAFDIMDAEIRGKPETPAEGALIIFRGMQSYNAENIKSLEDFDIAWVDEAQALSERSLRLLRPTIRKPGSELWFSWNPRYDTDAVDAFFRGENPPGNAIIVEVGYQDNPWLTEEIIEEMELDRRRDPEMAVHVWDGGYEVITEGAYYAKLIVDAEREGRCGVFPYRQELLVRTGWDIGVDDYSALWFVQDDGLEATVVDYFEANGLGAPQIIQEALPEYLPEPSERALQLLAIGRPRPYRYGTHFLPHDVGVREWGGGAKTRVQTLNELGIPMHHIHRGVQQGPAERINAVREVLPIMRFNTGVLGQPATTAAQKRVRAGLNRLRRYSRRFNEAMNTYTTVAAHDVNSHGSDALGEWAVNAAVRPPKPVAPKPMEAPPGYTMLPPPPSLRRGSRIVV